MRIIDAKAVERIAETIYTDNPCALGSVKRAIRRTPTLDYKDLVPQGEWLSCFEDWRQQMEGNKCSLCGFEYYGNLYNFCPNCGARMKGADT